MDGEFKLSNAIDNSGMLAKIPQFVSIKDFIIFTGLSRSTVNRKIITGSIPYVKIGNRILIPRSFLNTLQATAEAAMKEVKNDK